jgi:hypothetical protein
MSFNSYEILVDQLNEKLRILQEKTKTGVNAINSFTDALQQIESATPSDQLQTILNNINPSDFGLGNDLVESINYYKGEARDIIINKLKKFVDTSNEKGIYYAAMESLEPTISEYIPSYQLQNLKTITNNFGDIIDGKMSYKSQIQSAEKIMGFMADTMGTENVSNLNKAHNQLNGIIQDMKMLTDSDYNVDVEYLMDKYCPNEDIANNMKQINSALDNVCSQAMTNVNLVLSALESMIPRKYW